MKFFKIRGLMAALTLAFGFTAVPALAQTTTPTTSPTTTTCTAGCPSVISITGMAQWGGVVQGGFGTLDSSGHLVSGPNMTGTVTATKTGGGDVVTGVVFSGCLSMTCGTTTTTATISAFERGQVAVTGATSTPGNMLTLTNVGSLAAVSGAMLSYSPGSTATAPPPATH